MGKSDTFLGEKDKPGVYPQVKAGNRALARRKR
jgi:hypothetical protein